MTLVPREDRAPVATRTFPTAWARTAPAVAARELLQRGLVGTVVHREVNLRVSGTDQLSGLTGPVVFVANHSSHLDTPVLLSALPRRWARRTVVAAAADYFFDVWWRAVPSALVLNTFPIERRGGGRTTTPVDLLADGWNVLIYPEGTRSEDGAMGPFKLGPAFFAVQAGVPVVPVALRGTYAAMPRDSSWVARGRPPVHVRFGTPLFPRAGETPRQFGPRIRDAVVRLVAEDATDWWSALRAPAAPVPRTAETADGPGRWRSVWSAAPAPGPAPGLAAAPVTLAVRVIPCLDVDAGRVVKGIRFTGLRDAGDPVERAAEYARQGADELTFLDVSATAQGRGTTVEVVRRTAEQVFVPLTVGGGIRSTADVDAMLRAGADKVAVNSAALARPELVAEIADRFGNQVLVLALDARRCPSGTSTASGWEVTTHGGRRGTGLDAVAWAARGAALGAGEILLNSIDADGTQDGFDLAMTAAVRTVVDVPLIASGGLGTPGDAPPAVRAGADAVLAASVFHFGRYTVGDVKAALAADGVTVR